MPPSATSSRGAPATSSPAKNSSGLLGGSRLTAGRGRSRGAGTGRGHGATSSDCGTTQAGTPILVIRSEIGRPSATGGENGPVAPAAA